MEFGFLHCPRPSLLPAHPVCQDRLGGDRKDEGNVRRQGQEEGQEEEGP